MRLYKCLFEFCPFLEKSTLLLMLLLIHPSVLTSKQSALVAAIWARLRMMLFLIFSMFSRRLSSFVCIKLVEGNGLYYIGGNILHYRVIGKWACMNKTIHTLLRCRECNQVHLSTFLKVRDLNLISNSCFQGHKWLPNPADSGYPGEHWSNAFMSLA